MRVTTFGSSRMAMTVAKEDLLEGKLEARETVGHGRAPKSPCR